MCGIKDANSTEFEPNSPNKVIYMLRDLIGVEALGGTMRLGKYPCDLGEGTLARRAYGEPRSGNAIATATRSTRNTCPPFATPG